MRHTLCAVDDMEAQATVARADALCSMGRYDEALRLVSPILAADAEHLGAGLTAAVALINLRREAEAMTLLSRVAATHPSSADALRLMSFAAVRRDDASAAVAWAERAVEVAPWSVDVHLQRAEALALARRPRDAQDAARRALELASNSAHAHLTMAAALLPENLRATPEDLDEAERHLQRVLEIEPNHAAAHNELGRIHLARKQMFSATSAFARAVHADPSGDVALENMSQVFTRIVWASHLALWVLWWVTRSVHKPTTNLRPLVVAVAIAAAVVVLATALLLRRAIPRGLPNFLRDFRRREPFAALWGGCVGLSGLALAVMGLVGDEEAPTLHWVAGGALFIGVLLSWVRASKAKRASP